MCGAYYWGELVGLAIIRGGMDCLPQRRMGGRGRFPARTLHLVDIENLAGAAAPTLGRVREVQSLYTERRGVGAVDQVVVACSHVTLVNAALGWPCARYRVRSGPDGADLELLDVLYHEHVVERFSHVTIGSGDGAFAAPAARLAAVGVRVTMVSRQRSLSNRLALAAHEVIFLDPTDPAAAASQSSPVQAA